MGLTVGAYGVGRADDADSRHDAIGIAAIGAGVAAVIGALRPFERWRSVR